MSSVEAFEIIRISPPAKRRSSWRCIEEQTDPDSQLGIGGVNVSRYHA